MKITNQQIDDIFGDSPFIARLTTDKKRFEVLENTDPDWREVIPNDGWKHHGYFETWDEATTHQRRLHVRRILNSPAQFTPE